MKTAQALFLGLVATTLCVPVVYAQGAVLEEVVVTARKRAETLEESPVSVRAFTSDEIESAGIQKPGDFIGLTPNVTLVETQNAGTAFINVRGISQARNSEMSVAVLVDGVLMPNPNQFNQQLVDIQQIEVLRGPQGALYGRNAIGGAITIVTKQPGDEFEGKVELGADSGPGYTARGTASGPIGDSDVWKYRVSGSWVDTDGFIDNPVLGEEVDYIEDLNARARIIYEPNDVFSADLRLSASQFDGGALYFVIDAEADDTEIPVQTNNLGNNERDIYSASLKLEWEWAAGSFTSITSYDDVEEIFAGDQFDFLPREQSFLNLDQSGFGDFIRSLTGDEVVDWSQTQYLESDAISQEFRFTSPAENRLRWIAGTYFIQTDRYISTGNQIDRGNGVFDVKKEPRPSVFVDPTDPSPQLGLLVDEQDNFAWAVFGEVAYDLTDTLEASVSLRYDEDERETTTLTEPLYDPTGGLTTFGEVRKNTWDAWQPKFTLTWQPTDTMTVYGGFSRGFRSGGFNQAGVGEAVTEPGVEDLFEEQIADTWEAGVKGTFWDGRANGSVSVYYTDFENAYFFFFDAVTSTQNLGSIPEVTYQGVEIEGSALVTDNLSVNFGFGYTDSEIKEAADPADNGNQAPLVSEYTLNLGLLYQRPTQLFGGVNGVIRIDYARTGDTWWEPGNITVRSPYDLVDARVGIEMPDDWSLMLWAKNALDEEYNTEYSPGGFLWPGMPRQWGLEFSKRF